MLDRRQMVDQIMQRMQDELLDAGRAERLARATEVIRRSIRALAQDRFGRAPHAFIDRVQSTEDLDRLEEILMQVAHADRLEDIDPIRQ